MIKYINLDTNTYHSFTIYQLCVCVCVYSLLQTTIKENSPLAKWLETSLFNITGKEKII